MKTKQKFERELSPCSCGGMIAWQKEDVRVGKDIFKRLEVGTCDTCTAKYLTDDSADLISDAYRKKPNQK